jgi:hypothetical protein
MALEPWEVDARALYRVFMAAGTVLSRVHGVHGR